MCAVFQSVEKKVWGGERKGRRGKRVRSFFALRINRRRGFLPQNFSNSRKEGGWKKQAFYLLTAERKPHKRGGKEEKKEGEEKELSCHVNCANAMARKEKKRKKNLRQGIGSTMRRRRGERRK